MALDNSSRSFFQATYAPIQVNVSTQGQEGTGGGPPIVSRAWEKWSFATSLRPTATELSDLSRTFRRNARILRAIRALKSTATERPTISTVKQFRRITPSTLLRISEQLRRVREREIRTLVDGHQEILDAFYKTSSPAQSAKVVELESKPSGDWKRIDLRSLHAPDNTV